MTQGYFLLSLEQSDLYEGDKIVDGNMCYIKYGSVRTRQKVEDYMIKRLDDPNVSQEEKDNITEELADYGD